jgi:hypothetical protein
MNPKLVILSIPFQRLNRVLLGAHVFDTLLNKEYDILIISPFAEDSLFQKEFGAKSVHFLKWVAPKKFREPYGTLYSISEILRMQGFWYRYRNSGMAEFVANSNVQYVVSGTEVQTSKVKKIIFNLCRTIGKRKFAWKILDWIIGPSIFHFKELDVFCKDYSQITLVQSASWGEQDRMLSWMAKKGNWRTVLIPYTTDQIHSNGYLLCDFDAVCVQGSAEADYAKRLQNIEPSRIIKLGSAWLRHIDGIRKRLAENRSETDRSQFKTIMFAGLSTIYFPKKSQFDIVDQLICEIMEGRLSNVKLAIRPVALDKIEIDEWISRYSKFDFVQIQWPQSVCVGIDMDENARRVTMREELLEFVTQLSAADLLVISGFTTLIIDAASLGIPSISVFSDATGILKKRHLDLMVQTVVKSFGFDTLPLVYELNDLGPLVQKYLSNIEDSTKLAESLVSKWDYPNADFSATLLKVIEGDHDI